MADDTRDTSSAPPPAIAPIKSKPKPSPFLPAGAAIDPTTGLPKRDSKGRVLDKDGKPCRSCTSFADFTSRTSSLTKSSSQTVRPPSDCPPDVEALGRSTWTLLHSITASYPSSPSPTDRENVSQFMGLFSKLYPCWVCASDFQVWMAENKVRTESRDEFGKWMCEAHNEVNRKLGKKEFDCGKWEERWRTGWKDGSCD